MGVVQSAADGGQGARYGGFIGFDDEACPVPSFGTTMETREEVRSMACRASAPFCTACLAKLVGEGLEQGFDSEFVNIESLSISSFFFHVVISMPFIAVVAHRS